MLVIDNRYEIMDLSTKYNIPSIYDLLNKLQIREGEVACTDGKHIFIDPNMFNTYSANDQFFILCHEMLHIVYKHVEMGHDTQRYPHQELLNICQDVCINEYLQRKFKFRPSTCISLANLSSALMNRGYIHMPLNYTGILTTDALYKYIERRYDSNMDDMIKELMSQFNAGSNELDESLQEHYSDDVNVNKQTLKELTKRLKISNKMIADERHISEEVLKAENEQDGEYDNLAYDAETPNETQAGKTQQQFQTHSSGLQSTKTYSKQELIRFIKEFIGNEAVTKGRMRSYSRPNRRIQSSEFVMKGYKQYKNIKEISIYLDTSGSMSDQLVQNLFDTLKSLYQTTKFKLYEFKYDVREVDLEKENYLWSNGGTSISRVLRHIKDNNVDASIVVTDCEDSFSLKDVKSNVMFFTNDLRFKSDNPLVRVSYFN